MPECPGCGDIQTSGRFFCKTCSGNSRICRSPLPGQRLHIAVSAAGGRGAWLRRHFFDDRQASPAASEPHVGGAGTHGLHPDPAHGGHHPLHRAAAPQCLPYQRRDFQPVYHRPASGLCPDSRGKPHCGFRKAGIRPLCDHDAAGHGAIRQACRRLHRFRRRLPQPGRADRRG